jgi:hypothetical protein
LAPPFAAVAFTVSMIAGVRVAPDSRLSFIYCVVVPLIISSLLLVALTWRGVYNRYVGFTQDDGTYYDKAVPVEHLAHVELLTERFPGLQFYVSDYYVPAPDPFIMCTTHKGWRIVFGVWDEPSFGA